MKIGILSMNYTKNYGGILQSYGLYKYLESLGHDVCVINYKNSGKKTVLNYISKVILIFISCFSKNEDNSLRNPQPLSKQYLDNFVQFRKRMNYTVLVDEFSIESVCKDIDAVIIGSDQIWNDLYSNKLTFYFDWKYDGKKLAYAACTIFNKSPFLLRSKISKLLKGFDSITVRDRNTQHFVTSNRLAAPRIVVDPTCLYDYNEFIGENPIGEPYILTYILSSEINGGLDQALFQIKKKVGNIKVVSVSIPCESTIACDHSDVFYDEANPIEWVNLFYHASFVLTDSFHGIMFSMKFRKQFIAYCKHKQRASRLVDLSHTYALFNIIDNVSSIPDVFEKGVIDYKITTTIMNDYKNLSMTFLENEL